MIDWSIKELISSLNWTNANEDREACKDVVINGRTYTKYGTVTATTGVALQYKVYDPSVKQSKYIVLIGIAKQNPGDVCLDKELGYELATERAMISPVATISFDSEVDDITMELFIRTYVNALPIEFIKTSQELKAEGKDVNYYNRNNRCKNDYYNEYYKDFKKLGFDK